MILLKWLVNADLAAGKQWRLVEEMGYFPLLGLIGRLYFLTAKNVIFFFLLFVFLVKINIFYLLTILPQHLSNA